MFAFGWNNYTITQFLGLVRAIFGFAPGANDLPEGGALPGADVSEHESAGRLYHFVDGFNTAGQEDSKAGDPHHLENCFLVYVSSCLAGRGYPTGNVAPEMVTTVKHEVLRCLTVVHSKQASEGEFSYPYPRTLLEFNTRETLIVISLAFQEKFNGELDLLQRQHTINVLVKILTPRHANWFRMGCLLNFIAQQIATRMLPENDLLLERVVSYLTRQSQERNGSAMSRREHPEQKQTWLVLLRYNCLSHIPNEELLRISRQSRCYRVTEHILEKLGRYEEIFDCYLLDEFRHAELFSYISQQCEDERR